MQVLTDATVAAFTKWVNAAPRPHTATLADAVLTIGAAWEADVRTQGGVLSHLYTEHGLLLWTRTCEVAELIRLNRTAGWEFVRSAETAWRVKHSVKGPEMPETHDALRLVLKDQSAARFALEATRLEAVLAATTARGARIDTTELTATQERMESTHRQLRELMGFNPLPEENAERTIAWLAQYGVTVAGISSEAWASRTLDADSPLAQAAQEAYEQALWLRRCYAKVRELQRATKRGYVHSALTPFAQVSGRISSRGPALTNVAHDLRHLLIARSGHVLITADFDGVEPRVLAGLSGDQALSHDLANGDPYRDAADRAGYGRGDAARKTFKRVMLASAYGSAPSGIVRQMRVSLDEARRALSALWEPYTVAQAWLHQQKSLLPHTLRSGRPMGVIEHAHARPNLIIQSEAYDLFQNAALRVHDALPKGAHIWLTIHDELVVEAPERLTEQVCAVLRAQMPSECNGVPITAEPVVLGTHWRKA